MLTERSPQWEEAACAHYPDKDWWHGDGNNHVTLDTQHAIRICRTCPIQIECLQYGYVNQLSGVYGGTTDRQRNKLRRQGHRI